MPMKVLDMFCGMSAFRTAAELIGGFSFISHCDNDPTAVAPIALYTKRKENISVMTQEQSTPMKSLILTFLSAVSRASPSALPEQEGLSTIHRELSSLSFPEYLKRNTLHISSLKMYPDPHDLRRARFYRDPQ